MSERLKQIQQNLLGFWNKYTSKQKTIVISVVAGLFFAVVLLFTILSRTQYVELQAFEDTKSASELVSLLDESEIVHKESDDGTVVYVDKKSYTDAIYMMASNDIPGADYAWEDAFNNDMTTTESEKSKKFTLAKQSDIRSKLLNFNGVKDAVVYINEPVDDLTIFSENKDTTVSVMLTLSEEMSSDSASSLAEFLANAVGNTTTESIRIIDSNYRLLFGGSSDELLGGNIDGVSDYKQKLTNTIVKNVEELLIKYSYQDVQIGSANIVFDMDEVEEIYTEYTVSDGQEQGYYSNSYNYSATGSNGSGGIPGTDSNADETDYMLQNGSSSDSEVTLEKYDYLPNERVQNIKREVGAVKPMDSSIAVVATTYKVYDEEKLEKQGQLENQTFDEFILANNNRVKLTVDEEVKTLVSAATGISENNIQVVAWEQPIFQEKEESESSYSDYLMIVLVVLIIALLIFVVIKGTAPVEVTELEPELSVEQLLATTKESQSLYDIEFSDKSETRKMIEKFVDENPDAVAQLLRNWLNEGWG